MKLLHTADWHLGQRLMNRHRDEEHQLVLNGLLETIVTQGVDVLIVAGDIFDTPNPPNYAEQLYFDFLKNLIKTPCRHIVFIGGNHDAPSKLNAPKELLKVFNINVLGAITGSPKDQIVELKDSNGELEAVVVMVPFLRDRDLLFAEEGEGSKAQSTRLKNAISSHFETLAEEVKAYPKHIPIIVTGHLFATGASASGKQDNIYVGNIENIDAGQFPEVFDYVALGHIHRAQSVGGQSFIRYAGSIIPVSFSEVNDTKSVTIANFDKGQFTHHEKVTIPTPRYLFQVKGSYEEVVLELQKKLNNQTFGLTPWVEIEINQEDIHALVDAELRSLVAELGGEVLRIKVTRGSSINNKQRKVNMNLQDIDDLEVFEQKCNQWGLEKTKIASIKKDYISLKEWMLEQNE